MNMRSSLALLKLTKCNVFPALRRCVSKVFSCFLTKRPSQGDLWGYVSVIKQVHTQSALRIRNFSRLREDCVNSLMRLREPPWCLATVPFCSGKSFVDLFGLARRIRHASKDRESEESASAPSGSAALLHCASPGNNANSISCAWILSCINWSSAPWSLERVYRRPSAAVVRSTMPTRKAPWAGSLVKSDFLSICYLCSAWL